MRMNYTYIKQEILDNWEQFESNAYPHDLLDEFADSAVPVYSNEVIQDWQEMPSEFDDSAQEFDIDPDATIVQRMSLDLFNYYRHQYQKAYNELAETMPAKEDN